MLKISYALCLGLSPTISAQFTLEMRVAARNRKKSLKPLFWGFKVIDVDISKKYVASACYDKQHVCAYLQPFLRVIAECFARLSCGLGICPSHPGTVSKR